LGPFDLPAPLLQFLDDRAAAALPAAARLWLWGMLGGVASMGLYGLLSPQQRIGALRAELADAQRRLNAFDGEFADAWPLMRRMLCTSLRQLAVVLLPALIAMVPMLCLLAWLSTSYGQGMPGREYLPFGPPWIRGWEFGFLVAATIGALALKAGLRIR
jgi:hypothetical protein